MPPAAGVTIRHVLLKNHTVKKLLVTTLLTAFLGSSFAALPQQDTTGRQKQDTTSRSKKQKSTPQKRNQGKKKSDTTTRGRSDTTTRPPVQGGNR